MAELPKTGNWSESKSSKSKVELPFLSSRGVCNLLFEGVFNIHFLCHTSLCVVIAASFLLVFPLRVDSFFDNTTYITNRNSTGSNIICLGDSLTFGVGASPGHDYPSLLSKALGVKVINAGVDGDETADALKRLNQDVLSKNPKMVIVLLGGNDYFDEVPMEETFKNLDTIIKRIQDKGSMVVLVEIGTSVLGKSLEKRYDKVVLTNQTAYVPHIYKGILFNSKLKSDFKHPNDQGYKIIAHRILKVVKPLLEKAS